MIEAPQTAFSAAFSRLLGGAPCFPFWKGRVALYAILRALRIGPGDDVILPGYTCVMDVNPIKYLGARPVYVDIRAETYNLDAAGVEAALTPRTRAIIAQHTYGIPCDMDPLLELARHRGIPLIEDCCLALGSRYRGRLCGTFGAAAYWSFQWNKTITTGIGGLAAANDPVLAQALDGILSEARAPATAPAEMLRCQRLVHRLLAYPQTSVTLASAYRWLVRRGLAVGSSAPREHSPVQPGDFLTGMSAGQAGAGLCQLRALDRNLSHRRALAAFYCKALRPGGFVPPAIPEGADPVYVRYPVRVHDKTDALRRAAARRLEIGAWFESPLHPESTRLEIYDYRLGQCPHAEQAAREVINLPTHPRVSTREAARGVDWILGLASTGGNLR